MAESYLDKGFLLTATGNGFNLTLRGEGDMEAASAAFAAMTGLPVSATFTGLTPEERADMDGH